MTAPTKKVRDLTVRRDRCCLMCTVTYNLEWNHRQDSGMGGRGSKAPKITPADGVMLCTLCNQRIEMDAKAQSDAIYWGFKVRKFSPVLPEMVPVWYRELGAWYRVNRDGSKDRLNEATADEYRALAGILPRMEGTN